MSFAVIEKGICLHIGEDTTIAVKIFESKPKSRLVRVANLEELEAELAVKDVKECVTDESDDISNVLRQVLEKLDDNGINAENAEELRKKLQSGGEQLVAEVRSLGIRGMRVVGDGLSALGDLMKNASDEEEIQSQSTEKHDCCGSGSCHKPK